MWLHVCRSSEQSKTTVNFVFKTNVRFSLFLLSVFVKVLFQIFFCFCQVTCMETLKKVRKYTTTLPCKETSFVFRATLNLERSAVANLREQMTQGPLDDKVDIVINVKQLLCKTRYSCCKTLLLYIVNCSQHCVTGETV